MNNCLYNNSCIRFKCDLACKPYTEFEHWFNRCGLTTKNPLFLADQSKYEVCNELLKSAELDLRDESNYMHIGVYSGPNAQLVADLTTYLAIIRYCLGCGLYNGVYRLNFSEYLDEIKSSWNNRSNTTSLDNMKIWIKSSKCVIIYNLGLVRFGDFESQTLLSIFQERYDQEKYTIVVLENGKLSLPGKHDSMFYQKLKNEISARGVRV